MIKLESTRQTFDFDCGVSALQMVMAYYGVEFRADQLMLALKADNNGASIDNMILVAQDNGFQVIAGEGWALADVKRYIDLGHPVLVLLQAWAEKYMTLDDWKQDSDDGHYAVLIGYGKRTLVFEDPASFRKTWLREREFMARWHDVNPKTGARIDKFAMVLLGREPAPKTAEHMD